MSEEELDDDFDPDFWLSDDVEDYPDYDSRDGYFGEVMTLDI